MQKIETLYPVKKNNKKIKIILLITLIIILLIGIFVIFKNNNLESKKDDKQDQTKVEEKPNVSSQENKGTDEITTTVNFTCEKEGNYGTLDNKVKYKNNYRYEFVFSFDENNVTVANYIVNYIFNNSIEYNNASKLPIIFDNTIYEEKFDETNFTKSLIFHHKIEYPKISSNDYLNSYLKQLTNDNFSCHSID